MVPTKGYISTVKSLFEQLQDNVQMSKADLLELYLQIQVVTYENIIHGYLVYNAYKSISKEYLIHYTYNACKFMTYLSILSFGISFETSMHCFLLYLLG